MSRGSVIRLVGALGEQRGVIKGGPVLKVEDVRDGLCGGCGGCRGNGDKEG